MLSIASDFVLMLFWLMDLEDEVGVAEGDEEDDRRGVCDKNEEEGKTDGVGGSVAGGGAFLADRSQTGIAIGVDDDDKEEEDDDECPELLEVELLGLLLLPFLEDNFNLFSSATTKLLMLDMRSVKADNWFARAAEFNLPKAS
jgi:hypothetical protein